MPLPQTRDFPRTDQPPLDTVRRQRLVVALSNVESFTEHLACRRLFVPFGRLSTIRFHVKHPPANNAKSTNTASPLSALTPAYVRQLERATPEQCRAAPL